MSPAVNVNGGERREEEEGRVSVYEPEEPPVLQLQVPYLTWRINQIVGLQKILIVVHVIVIMLLSRPRKRDKLACPYDITQGIC